MSNVTFITSEYDQSEHALIEHEDGSFTCMPKAVWDELEAKREQDGTLS